MTRRLRIVLLAVLATGSLLLGAGAVSAAGKQVPFAALFSGSAGFGGPTTTVFTGSGIATSLGRVMTSGHAEISCFPPADSPLACVPSSGCLGGVPNTNFETLTAANGDNLSITSQDVACPLDGAAYPPTRYHGTGHWTVTGGTGRYAGASGQGSFDGFSDFGAGTFIETLIGTVTFR